MRGWINNDEAAQIVPAAFCFLMMLWSGPVALNTDESILVRIICGIVFVLSAVFGAVNAFGHAYASARSIVYWERDNAAFPVRWETWMFGLEALLRASPYLVASYVILHFAMAAESVALHWIGLVLVLAICLPKIKKLFENLFYALVLPGPVVHVLLVVPLVVILGFWRILEFVVGSERIQAFWRARATPSDGNEKYASATPAGFNTAEPVLEQNVAYAPLQTAGMAFMALLGAVLIFWAFSVIRSQSLLPWSWAQFWSWHLLRMGLFGPVAFTLGWLPALAVWGVVVRLSAVFKKRILNFDYFEAVTQALGCSFTQHLALTWSLLGCVGWLVLCSREAINKEYFTSFVIGMIGVSVGLTVAAGMVNGSAVFDKDDDHWPFISEHYTFLRYVFVPLALTWAGGFIAGIFQGEEIALRPIVDPLPVIGAVITMVAFSAIYATLELSQEARDMALHNIRGFPNSAPRSFIIRWLDRESDETKQSVAALSH